MLNHPQTKSPEKIPGLLILKLYQSTFIRVAEFAVIFTVEE